MLLSRFENILQRDYQQLPYVFHERTNASILASAASLDPNLLALQEFGVKRSTIKDRPGRGDIWIEDRLGRWSYDVECKIVFRSLRTNKPGNLRRAVKSATSQIRSLGRRGYRVHSIAVVCLVPHLSIESARLMKSIGSGQSLWTRCASQRPLG